MKWKKSLKFLFFILIAQLTSYFECGISFNPPPKEKWLVVPFYKQENIKWCGAACIQMWADYLGPYYTQEEIANYSGTGSGGADPEFMCMAVQYYCNLSNAYVGKWKDSEYGQGQAIGAQIASIKDSQPNIPLVNSGSHAILAIGFKWNNNGGTPVAEKIEIHNPAYLDGFNRVLLPIDYKQMFGTYFGKYTVVLGKPRYTTQGEAGFEEFLKNHGTYYGGPKDWRPKPIQ